jgi:hypothetical protein
MRRKSANAKLPKTNILKIDKDCYPNREWLADYVRTVRNAAALKGVRVIRVRVSKSRRKGYHFYVDIEPAINAQLANEIQFLMGDDCQRVDFNRARIESQLAEWNKLFERKHARLRTIYSSSRLSEV